MKPITQQLKRFSDDERAVSPVVGFVLIFALIMIVFTMYQASVVPAQNEEVEFEHSQKVVGQMGQLSSAVIDTSSTGEPRSVTIDTGVQYPSRAFAINPGNPAGTLETVETDGVTISGLDTEYGTGTYTFNTSFIVYRPNYNLLSEETEYFIQHGMLVKEYSSSDNDALASAGPLFSANGEELNLILIGGSFETHRMTTSVTLESINSITINSSVTTNGTISLPTTLPEHKWEEILNGTGHEIKKYEDSGTFNRVTIKLKPGAEIEISKIAPAGSDPDEVGIDTKFYIENETSLTPAVVANTSEYLTVSVRDQFGNLITSDVTIEATETGAGSLNTTSVTTNDGTATFAYESTEADSGSMVEVVVSLENGSMNGPITFELNYADEDSTTNETSREPISVAPGSLQFGTTDLQFRITPGSPINITGYSIVTKGELENLNETDLNHGFEIYQTKYVQGRPQSARGLHYTSAEPIQFDGQEYYFPEGPRVVTSSGVHLHKFDWQPDSGFIGFVDSYEEADMVIYFILEDGTKRPVYISGEWSDE